MRLLSRRAFLGGGLAASAGAACSRSAPPTATWPRTTTHEGVEFIELFPREADERAPLVVAIHGMGDTPDNWVPRWRTFPARVQIALPRAFDRYGDGWSWFPYDPRMPDEERGVAVGAAEERLWKAIAKLAGGRRPIVTGFSQGGILSFAIASRRSSEIVAAFPVAGACPTMLLPKTKLTAPVTAFHGTSDRIVPFAYGKSSVEAFARQGEARLHEYPGVGHTMSAQMIDDLWAGITGAATPRR